MKTIFLSIVLMLSLTAFGQDSISIAKLQVTTAIEKIEKLKMQINFLPVNPDSISTKKGVIWIGKDNSGKTVYFLKVRAKNYKIDSFDCNLKMNGEIYNIRTEGDSIKCYGDKGVVLFSIQ